jgi:hypothetical protein
MPSYRVQIIGILIMTVVLSGAGLYYATRPGTEPQNFTIGSNLDTTVIAEPPSNIVLIGWDGAQRDHLEQMIARNEVPTLMALAAQGGMVDIHITTGATDTKAGWAQILTGYVPEKTGVFSNSKYQPIPEGYTLFERLETYFGSDNIVTLAIVGKKGNVDADGPEKIPFEQWAESQRRQGRQVPSPKTGMIVRQGGTIIQENGTFYVVFPAKPYFHAENHMDMFLNGVGENENVGMEALKNLDKYKDRRFFFFIHFAQPDHAGHSHGENSQEYTDAIKSDDEWTGKIVQKLKELDLYNETLLYITADHGFDEGRNTHSYAPFVFLATNDPKVARNGDRADITPTILKRFGLDLSKIEPPLDGAPLDEPMPVRVASQLKHSGSYQVPITVRIVRQSVTCWMLTKESDFHFPTSNSFADGRFTTIGP